eukprot:8143815-Lingulodinium_polyedra.AAC.1
MRNLGHLLRPLVAAQVAHAARINADGRPVAVEQGRCDQQELRPVVEVRAPGRGRRRHVGIARPLS